MRSSIHRFASHLVAFSAGGLLVLVPPSGSSDKAVSSSPAKEISPRPPRPGSKPARTLPRKISSEVSIYAAAWESLKDGRYPRSIRLAIQQQLLEEWSQHDLEAALQAILSEGFSSCRFISAKQELSLSPIILRADPEKMEKLIAAEAFGLDTVRLRVEWLTHLAAVDPPAIIDRLEGLPEEGRVAVAGSAFRHWPSPTAEPADWHAAWERSRERIEASPGKRARDAIAAALSNAVSNDDLIAGYLLAKDSFVRRLHMDAWLHGAGDPFSEFDEKRRKRIETLPEPFRSEVKEEMNRREGEAGE